MTEPSLKAARAELKRAIEAADDWHTEAVRGLPNASWRDLDLLEIERCNRNLAAYEAFRIEERALQTLVDNDR